MKKLLSLLLFGLFLSMNTITFAVTSGAVLPNNTPILIQANETYDPNNLTVGDNVKFTTVNNITLNGQTVIAKGTTVNATVQNVHKRGRIGIPAEITIGDFNTTNVKGAKIPLTGSIEKRAKSKMALSITLSLVVIPLFLLMKGKETSIEQGYQTTVYTTGSIN